MALFQSGERADTYQLADFVVGSGVTRELCPKGQNVRLLAVRIALACKNYSNICTYNRIKSDYLYNIL